MKLNRRLLRYLSRFGRQVVGLPVFFGGFFIPRRRDLWVFGAWHGEKYADNPKFLYSYIKETEQSIHAVWITKSDSVLAEVVSLGGRAHHAYSLKGFWYCLRAGVVFFSHDVEDVNELGVGGATVINLTHGTPLKRIRYDANSSRFGYLTGFFDKYVRPILAIGRSPDFIFSASEVAQKRLASAWRVSIENIKITGYSRWSALRAPRSHRYSATTASFDVSDFSAVFLYAPTHRMQGHGGIDIGGEFDFKKILPWLEKNNILLLVRAHSALLLSGLQEVVDGGNGFVAAASSELVEDVNCILPDVDVLITDYSSVMYDFTCLKRPIVLLAPDLEQYLNEDVGVYGNYEYDAPGPIIRRWSELPGIWESLQQGDFVQQKIAFEANHAKMFDGLENERIVDLVWRLTG